MKIAREYYEDALQWEHPQGVNDNRPPANRRFRLWCLLALFAAAVIVLAVLL